MLYNDPCWSCLRVTLALIAALLLLAFPFCRNIEFDIVVVGNISLLQTDSLKKVVKG
jgi:hypothetical protein